MKILNTKFKPLRPIPSHVPYDKFKDFLYKHHSLHYFFHLTYCRLVLKYEKKPYSWFLGRGIKKNKKGTQTPLSKESDRFLFWEE